MQPTPPAKPTSVQRPFLQRIIFSPFSILTVLFLSWLVSILVEWGTMAIFYHSHYQHSHDVFHTEINYLRRDFSMVYGVTQKVDKQFEELSMFKLGGMQTMHSLAGSLSYHYFTAALYTTKTFLLRVTVCLFCLPAFFLVAVVALVEGLVRRDLRRFGGGLEHAFLYHIFKRNLTLPLVGSVVFYLSAPFVIHPNWVFVPALLLFGLMVMQTAALFKKYL